MRARGALARLACVFFCAVAVGSIGEEAYVALPKGGVTPEHVLVIPVTHQGSYAAA